MVQGLLERFYVNKLTVFPEAVNILEIFVFFKCDKKMIISKDFEVYLNEEFQQYKTKSILPTFAIPM